jgi:hypothetical protein
VADETSGIDARSHLAALVGKVLPTMTGRPNRVLSVEGDRVMVATEKSPEGQPVPIEWVQAAMDALLSTGELEINAKTVGYRSAFVGAVLVTLPGAEAALSPRRIRVAESDVQEPAAHPPQVRPIPVAARERPVASQEMVNLAVATLDRQETSVPLNSYSELTGIDLPGMYAWWIDAQGAAGLAPSLGLRLTPGRIYVGQAGATAWPSGKRRDATLLSRISLMHLGARITFSTLRLTLAASLREGLSLIVTGAKILAPESEERLTEWMHEHLTVSIWPFDDVDALDEVEHAVLNRLDPPLNLRHMPLTPMRQRLKELRRRISVGD